MKAIIVLAGMISGCTIPAPHPVTGPPDADAANPAPASRDGSFCVPGCDCFCGSLQALGCPEAVSTNGITCYQRCAIANGSPGAWPLACDASSKASLQACGVCR